MGLQLVVKNEDFSAISVGKIGIGTSVSSGLAGLFCLSSVLGAVTKNWAGGTDATIVGSPTVAENGVTSDQGNFVDFNIVSTGSRTMAFVFNNTGVTNATYFSSFAPAPTYGEYVRSNGSNINFDSATSGNITVASAVRDELVSAICDNGVNRKLYLPRTAASSYVISSSASQNLTTEYRTSINAPGSAASRAMAFAYWDRVLTMAELDVFYNEMRAQLATLGVATI